MDIRQSYFGTGAAKLVVLSIFFRVMDIPSRGKSENAESSKFNWIVGLKSESGEL